MLGAEEDMTVVGTAHDGAEALVLCEAKTPDLVLMDIRMPDIDGIQATRLIKNRFPHIRVVMLTTFQDKPNIEMALAAGAEGYLLKTDRIGDVSAKLRVLVQGAAVMDSVVLRTLTSPQIRSVEQLTPREKDVLDLVVQGLTNRQIAEQLFLSEGTVRNVLTVVMGKLNVKNRTQLSIAVRGSIDNDNLDP